MSAFDLVIRGGRVVTAATDSECDIGIRDGVITALGLGLPPGERELDARGRLVLPGGIDAHVHLTPVDLPDRTLAWADDYASGTRAAAAGGVTTVGDITFPLRGEGMVSAVERVARLAAADAVVDFLLHPVLLDPSPMRIDELDVLAGSGSTSVKIFMQMGQFDARAPEYLAALRRAGAAGLLTMIHCEDGAIIGHCTHQLVVSGQTGLAHFPETRPVLSESSAVERAIAFASAAEAPIYIVHLSSAAALEAASRARARGMAVYVETRPIYLTFTRSRFDGPEPGLYVGNPPLREDADVDALWAGLASGQVSTCCTDHAPWPKEEKLHPGLDVAHTRPGMADLETMLPSLFSHGVRTGRISLQRFVEVTSTNAARLFGIYPQKGTIGIGSDADLVIWDPELTKTVDSSALYTRAKLSLLDGVALTGWPVVTISRGDVVAVDGRVVGESGRGRRVLRQASGATADGAPAMTTHYAST